MGPTAASCSVFRAAGLLHGYRRQSASARQLFLEKKPRTGTIAGLQNESKDRWSFSGFIATNGGLTRELHLTIPRRVGRTAYIIGRT
jgi:hypothetical protein